ncbi:hypothetical protein PLESTB_001207300 [Pleodorina starrii]|uniref:Protein kinase domain-containing protein n=1 Tax=Pleodorina starrii TaxID=330485 RepID=A0A9W6BRS6_9CHLO|nr:hypothetical protein PLESTB_001207300 [Pleodorina starrii]GLC71329.1 hypothetical protein PLESTF_001103600 [Pleodorina starrii]
MSARSQLTSNPDTADVYTAIAESANSIAEDCTPQPSSSARLLAAQAQLMGKSLATLANMMRVSAWEPQGIDAAVAADADATAQLVSTFACHEQDGNSSSSSSLSTASSSCGASSCCSSSPSSTSTITSQSTTTITATDGCDGNDSDVKCVLAALSNTSPLPVLNPYSPLPSGAKQLHAPSEETNTSVWRATLQQREEEKALALKVVPFHSPEVAARLELEGDGFHTGSGEVAEVLLEEEACREALMAVAVARANAHYVAAAVAGGAAVPAVAHEIFLQPQLMAVQDCPLRGGPRDLGHDRQLVMGFKYCGAGNAAEHLRNRVAQLVQAVASEEGRGRMMTRGSAPAEVLPLAQAAVERIAEGLGGEVDGVARSVYDMMGRMHELGFLINDLKLENMMFDSDVADFRFVDAEAVRRCRLGEKLPGAPSKHTEDFAAPEQLLPEEEAWSDSFRDVYAGGASMKEALAICLDVCGGQLAYGADLGAVMAAFRQHIQPLRDLLDRCTAAAASERPSAAEVMEQLQRDGRLML